MMWWHKQRGPSRAVASCLLASRLASSVGAYDLDPDSKDSIKTIASDLAEDMLTFYAGNKPGGTPGLLTLPYYWWYGGAMFGALIDYWYFTGDTKWNDLVTEGMLRQVGKARDYMPIEQTLTEGNDDQGFWGLAAMQAAEYNFPNPPSDQPQWLALAQAVFNTQAARWDPLTCGGGLRWQIFDWNKGINYKNSISQACFFSLAARLALFTGNTTYSDWAERSWDWMIDVKFIDTDTYWIIDGADVSNDCSDHVPYLFTYNAGGFLSGAAAMYNLTGSDQWKDRVDGLVGGIDVFFQGEKNDIMVEVACERVNNCNYDQESFKAYLSRWLGVATKWAPHISSHVQPKLRASAQAAARQCTGGANGRMCGLKWANNSGKWDGTTGLGHQMAALEVVLTQLNIDADEPLTGSTGGTSKGDPSAGKDDSGAGDPYHGKVSMPPLSSAGSTAGAAVLTAALLLGLLVGVAFMFVDESADKPMAERWADMRAELSDMKTAAGAVAGAIVAALLCGAFGTKRKYGREGGREHAGAWHDNGTAGRGGGAAHLAGARGEHNSHDNKRLRKAGPQRRDESWLPPTREPTKGSFVPTTSEIAANPSHVAAMATATRSSAARPAAARTRLPMSQQQQQQQQPLSLSSSTGSNYSRTKQDGGPVETVLPVDSHSSGSDSFSDRFERPQDSVAHPPSAPPSAHSRPAQVARRSGWDEEHGWNR